MKRNYSTLLVLFRHFICIVPRSNLCVNSSLLLFPKTQFEFKQTFEFNEVFHLGCFSGIFTHIHTYVHTCIMISTAGLNGIIGGHCSKGLKSEMFSLIETFLFSTVLDKLKQELPWLIPREKNPQI